MITLIADDNWSGQSLIDGVLRDNLDSTMDIEEHKRIVREAVRLLEGFSMGASGWGAGPGLGEANVAFDALKNCYTKTNFGRVVYVTKGIHQPRSNPHMQLNCAEPGKQAHGMVFHLDLSAELITSPLSNEEDGLFSWTGVQFTFISKGLKTSWPKDASAAIKKGQGMGKRRRRKSVSMADHDERLQALQEHLAHEEAKRQERIERERHELEEARLAQEQARLEQDRAAAAQRERANAMKRAQVSGQQRGQLFRTFTQQNKTFAFISGVNKKAIVDDGKTIAIPDKDGKKGGRLRYDSTQNAIVKEV